MRKIGQILSLAVMLVIMQASLCFGGTGLIIEDTYPKDGSGGFQPANMGVTLYFNQDVASETNRAENDKLFKIVDQEGVAQPFMVLYHPEEEGKVMVLLKETLKVNSDYKFTISPGFTATSGDVLEKEMVISFKTRDTSNDTTVYMILTAIMFAGIMIFSMRSAKKEAEKQAAAKKGPEKVNPYKVSKETGKPVHEVVEKDKKRKEKEQEKKAREEAKKQSRASNTHKNTAENSNGNYRVKAASPASRVGSTYVAAKKAKAEAQRAKSRAAGTTNPKGGSGKRNAKRGNKR